MIAVLLGKVDLDWRIEPTSNQTNKHTLYLGMFTLRLQQGLHVITYKTYGSDLYGDGEIWFKLRGVIDRIWHLSMLVKCNLNNAIQTTLQELSLKIRNCRSDWPKSYWDDWMRLNKTRKSRQCIRPEVCRTYNFGALGSSKGQFFKRFLAPIRISSGHTDWSKQDLSYLRLPR